MSQTFERIKELVKRNKIKISDHGYDEIAEDDIFIKDIIADVNSGYDKKTSYKIRTRR